MPYMDQYLQQLLSQQPRVIIPNLGAFISSPEGGMMFNQYLNFDDNALTAYVAQNENISEDEARQRIADYSNQLKQRLDSGEKINIQGVGTLSKDGEIYNFESDANAAETQSAQPTTTIDLSEATKAPTETSSIANNNTFVYEEDHSSRNIIIIILIALLFIIGVILCLFVINKDNCVYNFFFGEKEAIEQVEVAAPDTTQTIAPDTTTVVETPKEVAPQIDREKRYNIIVGTYKNEKVAQKRVEQLKAKGFENAIVGTFRGDYVAIIDSYDRLPDAEARQEFIVDTYRIESYITNSGE